MPVVASDTTPVTACWPDCGACCDPVRLSFHPDRLRDWRAEAMAATVAAHDPATDEGWAAWVAQGFTDEQRDECIEQSKPGSQRQLNADFLAEHWTVISGDSDPDSRGPREVRCDVFDPATRRCGDYEGRPPICAGYPHYGEPLKAGTELDPVCAFNAEIRTVLPIVAIT